MEQSAETKKKDCPDAREQFLVEILEDERVDDLQRNGYHIIQKRNGFCFGMDAVLLAGFARVNPGERAIDLGTGTGIIPILLEARYEGEHYTGLEIQEEVAEMARRSVRLNGLENKVDIALGDIKEASVAFSVSSSPSVRKKKKRGRRRGVIRSSNVFISSITIPSGIESLYPIAS